MVKINKEEYEILKSLDDKWKWIAREGEYVGLIFCFREKPHKDIRSGEWGPDATQFKYLGGYDSLFQFIQWEDEEPYNIAELIEEYEHKEFYDYVGWKYAESEETEVKKGIEWLKREIHKELEDWHGVEGGIDGDGINEIMLLINQYEESEVRRLERKIKELDSYNDELIRDNNQFRNELDNQEVLSKEWIDEHSNGPSRSQYVWVDDLKEILVSKKELPVIPKFVADWIEENKKKNRSLVFAIKHIYDENEIGKSPKVFIWMETDDNEEVFARAWLDGYTAEEEQKYYVLDSEDIPLLERANDQTYKTTTGLSIYEDGRDNSRFELTEKEIKSYDERYMTFAKPVEEIEK